MSKTPKIKKSKKADRFDEGTALWESRKLGASKKHATRVSAAQEKALDEATGLQLLTFRIQKPLVDKLRQLAQLEGIGYQPFMRQILTRYVRENEHKLADSLTPQQASERADKLLVQAIKHKKEIASLAPLTNERLEAENSYAASLGNANKLYNQASEKCLDPVLKNHLALRLSQIDNLLNGKTRR